jgi:uncharacterized membrane protein
VRARVFAPSCIRCHGNHGNVNLETYEAAREALDDIKNEVYIEKSMPPKAPLSEADQALVRAWIEGGALEFDTDRPIVDATPSPVPSTVPSSEPSAIPSSEPSAIPSSEPSAIPSSEPSAVPSPAPSPSASPVAPRVGYTDVRERIFAPLCLRCHDSAMAKPKAGVVLNTYENALRFLDRIEKEALTKKAMPPRNPLSAENQELLRKWLEAGAPR